MIQRAARSIRASEVWPLYSYSVLRRRLRPGQGERALHNPGQAGKLDCALPSFYDSQIPSAIASNLTSELPTLVASIRNNGADAREERTQAASRKKAGRRADRLAASPPEAIGRPNVSTTRMWRLRPSMHLCVSSHERLRVPLSSPILRP